MHKLFLRKILPLWFIILYITDDSQGSKIKLDTDSTSFS